MYYRCALYEASVLEYGIPAIKEDVLAKLNSYLIKNDPETVIQRALYQGDDVIETELDPSTDYLLVAVGVEYDANQKAFVAVSAAFTLVFSTAAAPTPSAEYAAYVGAWTMPINYLDYVYGDDGKPVVGEDGKKQIALYEGTSAVVVEPQFINESYYIYFPLNDVTPVLKQNGNVYFDSYVGLYDEDGKSMLIPNGQVGSEGFTWDFKLGMDNAVALVFSSDISEYGATSADTEESLDYVEIKANGDNLEFVNLGLEEGYSLYVSGLIVYEGEDGIAPVGYYGRNEVVGTTLSPYVEQSSVKKASVSKGLKSIDFKSEKTLSIKSATLK